MTSSSAKDKGQRLSAPTVSEQDRKKKRLAAALKANLARRKVSAAANTDKK